MEVDWFKSIIAPALVSILVGVGTGYVTVKTTISIHTERIEQNEKQIDKIITKLNKRDQYERVVSDRLTRLETKIDLLLDDKLRVNTDDN